MASAASAASSPASSMDTLVWPRGLTSSLTSIATTAASTTLELRPASQMGSVFKGMNEWVVQVVNCAEESPERAIVQSQEKLRQHSVSQFGAIGGSEVIVGKGPQPLLQDSVGGAAKQSALAEENPYLSPEYVMESLKLLDLIENSSTSSSDVALSEEMKRMFSVPAHVSYSGESAGNKTEITLKDEIIGPNYLYDLVESGADMYSSSTSGSLSPGSLASTANTQQLQVDEPANQSIKQAVAAAKEEFRSSSLLQTMIASHQHPVGATYASSSSQQTSSQHASISKLLTELANSDKEAEEDTDGFFADMSTINYDVTDISVANEQAPSPVAIVVGNTSSARSNVDFMEAAHPNLEDIDDLDELLRAVEIDADRTTRGDESGQQQPGLPAKKIVPVSLSAKSSSASAPTLASTGLDKSKNLQWAEISQLDEAEYDALR
jgi:hypothetical protein